MNRLPQYYLFTRYHDQAMMLVDRKTRREVVVAQVGFDVSPRSLLRTLGVFVRIKGRISMFLMPSEVHLVDEFPQAL